MRTDTHLAVMQTCPAFKGVLVTGKNPHGNQITLNECILYFNADHKMVARVTHEGSRYEKYRVFDKPKKLDNDSFNELKLLSVKGGWNIL